MDEDFSVDANSESDAGGDVDPGGGGNEDAGGVGDSAELLDSDSSTESLMGEDQGLETDDSSSPPTETDPYKERLDAYEQRIASLEAELRKGAEQRLAPRKIIPDALRKPTETWTEKDLQEYTDYRIQQGLESAHAVQEWRGKLNARELGEGNDFDSVVEKHLYSNPEIQSDPTSLAFAKNLNPLSQYVLALVHEVSAAAKGDPVRAIKAIRNGLKARTEGARDVQKAVTAATRKVAMGLVKGGKPTSTGTGKQSVWDMDDNAFRRFADGRKGA